MKLYTTDETNKESKKGKDKNAESAENGQK